MSIVLVAVGHVEKDVGSFLKVELGRVFQKDVSLGNPMPEPYFALNRRRKQFLATAVLQSIVELDEYAHADRILGVFDHDLYIPALNFVFGIARRKAAIISLTRLRQEFYGLESNLEVFFRRVLTEAVHELGHTFGISHCDNMRCVMFFSNSLYDTDRKRPEFCTSCKSSLPCL